MKEICVSVIVLFAIVFCILRRRRLQFGRGHRRSPRSVVLSQKRAYEIEGPRLIQIIEESRDIINKTKNEAVAARRVEDIRRVSKRLFEILPPGKELTYIINGQRIGCVADLALLDDVLAQWRAERLPKPPKKRQPIAPLPALPACDDFEKWRELFFETGVVPYGWDAIAEYDAIQHYPLAALLSELQKMDLMKLATVYGLSIAKKATNRAIEGKLSAVIPKEDEGKILALVNERWASRFAKAKEALLAHMAAMGQSPEEVRSRYRYEGARIEISPASDCCPWCALFIGREFKVDELQAKHLPPYHPGCRCGIVPALPQPS